MAKDLNEWTRKEFDALPLRESWNKNVECHSIIILPQRQLHDSGYRCMDFVAVGKDGKPLCRLSGCSDVVHIDRISPPLLKPRKAGWSIDCLKTSGLLRLWCNEMFVAGSALSSFQLFLKGTK